jgi:hypothetical protein
MAYRVAQCLGLLAFSNLGHQFTTVFAQGTVFSYQGRLNAGGGPANGLYDFSFALYDTAIAGTQQGTTVTVTAIGVTNGLFTVMLDFGDQFSGGPRWLGISVRTNGTSTSSELSPRQPLTPAPYAITAENLNGALPASQLSGVVALTQLPAAVLTNHASGATLSGDLSGNFSGSFYGSGAGLSGLNASQVTSGTLPLGQLPSGVLAGGVTNLVSTASVTIDVSDAASPYKLLTANNDLSFAVAGATSGQARFASVYIWAGATNRTLILNPSWQCWGCTATNTALSNKWTAMHFMSVGTDPTNIHVRLEEQ